jgi:ribosomal protein S18 acetylase RimI-like enzyme
MVRLVPMTAAEFRPYIEASTREYAEENARAGRWTSNEALAEAQKQIQGLLPAGPETPNHFLYQIVAGPTDERVGILWLAVEPRGGFVYDLRIEERFRRHGYAEAGMRLAEAVVREKGADRISLHVFGGNTGARKLYEKLGYAETNVAMSKSLPRSPP